MKTVRTTVSLSSDQLQQLQSLADKHDLSLAWLIRQAVSEYLDRVNDQGAFQPLKKTVMKEKH
jgi:predicted transcriptional regulator